MPFLAARITPQPHEARLHRRISGVVQTAKHKTRPKATNSGIDGNTEESVVQIGPAACDLVMIAHRRLLWGLEPLRRPDVGHTEVGHRLPSGRSVPVALHRSGIDHIARSDMHLLVRRTDPALTVEDIQHLLAGVDMPMGARSILEVNEAHRHAALLLRSQKSFQLGLARECADLLLLRVIATHDLHRSPSFIVGPFDSVATGCCSSMTIQT